MEDMRKQPGGGFRRKQTEQFIMLSFMFLCHLEHFPNKRISRKPNKAKKYVFLLVDFQGSGSGLRDLYCDINFPPHDGIVSEHYTYE